MNKISEVVVVADVFKKGKLMEAKMILSITKCGDLFPYGENNVKAKYKELVKEWHPDTNSNPEASDVFLKITQLYNQALDLLSNGQWEKTNYVLISKDTGGKIALNYDTCFDFELGICYVTKTKVVYVLGSDKEKYYNNAIRRIKNLQYKDKQMEEKISICLPNIYKTFKTSNGEHVIVLEKAEDVYPLKNVLEYYNGKIEDKHVAWIISRLYNLACYLKFSGIVHNGININNCFISPEFHSILLLGGWWYATKENENMIGTTKDVFSVMSVQSKTSKKSSSITDLESIKLLGRLLLGETNCRKLSLDSSIPKPFINFLISGSSDNSYEEFSKWDKALNDSYGKRKFIKMEIKNLYERKGD